MFDLVQTTGNVIINVSIAMFAIFTWKMNQNEKDLFRYIYQLEKICDLNENETLLLRSVVYHKNPTYLDEINIDVADKDAILSYIDELKNYEEYYLPMSILFLSLGVIAEIYNIIPPNLRILYLLIAAIIVIKYRYFIKLVIHILDYFTKLYKSG